MKNNALLTAAFIWILHQGVSAATVTITSNTNWSSLTPTPDATTSFIIKNGATLTVNVSNAVANDIAMGAGGSSAGNGTLLFNAGSVLNLSGTVGTVTLGLSAFYTGTVNMAAGGTLYTKGFQATGGGTVISGSGTIELTGTSGLLASITTFNNLTINAPGTLSLVAPITVNGSLDIIGGTLSTSASNYAVTVNANVSISNGATLVANNSSLNIKGNVTNNGTFTQGGSTVALIGAALQTIIGNITFNNLTVNNTSVGLPSVRMNSN